jgi:DNA-binding XRE family transcriptional regulator
VSLVEQLRVARVVQGYTQTEMARKFGASLSTIKFWKQNRYQPTPAIRAQVAVFLKSGGT